MSQSGAAPQHDPITASILSQLETITSDRKAVSKEIIYLRNEVRQVSMSQGLILTKLAMLVGDGETNLKPIVPVIQEDLAAIKSEVDDLKEFRTKAEPFIQTYPETKQKVERIYLGAGIIAFIGGLVGGILKFIGFEIFPHVKKG